MRLHRVKAAHGFEWLAIRTDDGIKARKTQGRAKADILKSDDETPEARLFRILKRRANFALPCPTNPEIEADLGVKNGSYLLGKLVKAGLIRVEDGVPGMRRRVTILATGLRTKAAAL